MTDAVEQLELLPDDGVGAYNTTLELDALPDDYALVGDPPTPAMIRVFRKTGLCPHILVRMDSAGNYHVVDGRRRVKAWRHILYQLLQAAGDEPSDLEKQLIERFSSIHATVVTSAGDLVADTVALSAHANRRDNVAVRVEQIGHLHDAGASERQIARETGMSLGTISRSLAMRSLSKPLLDGLMAGAVTGEAAEAASKRPKDEQRELASVLKRKGRLRLPDVAAVRKVKAADTAEQFDFGAALTTPSADGVYAPFIAAFKGLQPSFEQAYFPGSYMAEVPTPVGVYTMHVSISGPTPPKKEEAE